MKKAISFFLILLFFSFFLASVSTVNAKGDVKDTVTLDNPLGTKDNPNPTPQEFIGRIIKAILGIVGSLALVMFVYGGFNIMTAAGTAEKVEKGKQILVWATIGLIVIFTPVKYRAVVDFGQGI